MVVVFFERKFLHRYNSVLTGPVLNERYLNFANINRANFRFFTSTFSTQNIDEVSVVWYFGPRKVETSNYRKSLSVTRCEIKISFIKNRSRLNILRIGGITVWISFVWETKFSARDSPKTVGYNIFRNYSHGHFKTYGHMEQKMKAWRNLQAKILENRNSPPPPRPYNG